MRLATISFCVFSEEFSQETDFCMEYFMTADKLDWIRLTDSVATWEDLSLKNRLQIDESERLLFAIIVYCSAYAFFEIPTDQENDCAYYSLSHMTRQQR
jgi:hypothetical protein